MPYILNANSEDLDGQMRLRDNEKKFDKSEKKRKLSQKLSNKNNNSQFHYTKMVSLSLFLDGIMLKFKTNFNFT